jgi:hypothetical protein
MLGKHGFPTLTGSQNNTYLSKSQKVVSLNSYKGVKTICKFVNGKTAVLTLMVMIIAVVLSSSTAHAVSSSTAHAAVTPTCDKSLWQHVFLPTRLHIVDPCITATGVIKSIHVENDGDFHIKLLADNGSLINQANIKFENGDLVLEAICQNPVSRSEVGSACDSFNHSALSIPPVGSHVTVTGSYVLDTRNNNWAEIHPITSIAAIP